MSTQENKKYPEGGTAKRTTWGSFVTFLSVGVRALKKIALIPLFLWAWGQAMYGEWVTLYALISYLSLSELGMGQFIKTKLTKLYAKGDKKGYLTVLKSSLGIYTIMVAAALALFVAFIFIAPFEQWFGVEQTSVWTARWMLLILGAYSLLGTLFNPITSMYSTLGEFVRGRVVRVVREFLLVGFIALTLWLGGEFISVASWYLILMMAFLLFVWFDIKFRHPEIKWSKGKIDWDLAKGFIVPGLTFLMVPLANMIKVEGSVLLIGGALGASVVAYFSVHRTLANMIQKMTAIVQPSLQPEIAATESRGQYKKLRKVHNLFLKAALSLTITSGTFLLFTGKDIIRIWTGGRIDFHLYLWIALLVLVVITSFWDYSSVFQIATNNYNRYALAHLSSSILGLGTAFFFVDLWGAPGVIISFLVWEVLLNSWFIPYHTLKLIKEKARDFAKVIALAIPMLILQLLSGWLLYRISAYTLINIISVGVAVSAVGLVYTFYVWITEQEEGLLRKYFPIPEWV